MRILDFYIGKTVLQQILVVFLVLLGLFTFVTLIDELGDLGQGSYGIWEILKYVVLTTPKNVYELFPMAVLLGCMLGMSQLVVDSELVVMRASGLSLWRIIVSVLKTSLILVLLAFIVGEFVVPFSEHEGRQLKNESVQQKIKQQTNFGLWMRDQQTYVNIGELLPDLSLLKVRIFEFDDTGHLRSIVYAGEGEHNGECWRLDKVKQTLVSQEGADVSRMARADWCTEVSPAILQVFLTDPAEMPLDKLKTYIDHLEQNNQETAKYRLAFWNKIVSPLSAMVMVLLAFPFIPKQARGGSLGKSLFIGIMVGLAFYVANRGFGYFILVYDFSPLFGAVMPAVISLTLAVYLIRKNA